MNVRIVRWPVVVVAFSILGCSGQGGAGSQPQVTKKSLQELQAEWQSTDPPADGGGAQTNPSGAPAKP